MNRQPCRADCSFLVYALCIAVYCGSLAPRSFAAERFAFLSPVPASEARYEGAGSCSAAACHGSVQARNQTKVLQNEYSTWVLQDKHARSWNVLNSTVSQRMAAILGPVKLGAADAAHAPKCLACHALYVPDRERAREFDLSDGVSCENCHGPSSLWLGPHTARDWTHEKSLAMGMYDTKDLRRRTEKCLTCHLGTTEKYVDHEMIAAGHPDLVFELDSFQAVEPVHWVEKVPGRPEQADKDPLLGVRMWSVGQAAQLRESLNRLIRRTKGTEGNKGLSWPEYGELDCFACHHSLTPATDSWRLREDGYYGFRRPGDPPYNLARVVVFEHMANEVDARSSSQLKAAMTKLAVAVSSVEASREHIELLAQEGADISNKLADELATTRFDRERTLRVMRAICADADYISNTGERSAEQAAMAIDSFYIAYSKETGVNKEVRSAIDALFQELQNPSSYSAPKFSASLKRVGAALK